MGCIGSKLKDDVVIDAVDVEITKEPAMEAAKAEAEAKAEEEDALRLAYEHRLLTDPATLGRQHRGFAAMSKAKEEAKMEDEANAKAEMQIKAQQAAAVRLQATVRGKSDRRKAEPMKQACDDYRLNIQAKKFTQCMSGWPKAALVMKKSPDKAQRILGDTVCDRIMRQNGGYCACERYVVDMESANFGECMCGRPKAEHWPAKASESSRAVRVNERELRANFASPFKTSVSYAPISRQYREPVQESSQS